MIATDLDARLAPIRERLLPPARQDAAHLLGLARAVAAGGLPTDERDRAARLAHRLAGTLGVLGALAAAGAARDLEAALRDGSRVDVLAAAAVLAPFAAVPGRPDAPAPAPARAKPSAALLVLAAPAAAWVPPFARAARALGHRVEVATPGGAPGAAGGPGGGGCADLVVLDAAAPGALAAVTAVRAAAAGSVVPLLVVGEVDLATRIELVRLGARAFLPAPGTARALLESAAELLAARAGGQVTVVALDDNPPVIEAVRALLEPEGVRVVGVTDPDALWPALDEHRPDLLLLDLHLPRADGLELCRALRADVAYARLPVVVLTASDHDAVLDRAFASGADDFVCKHRMVTELVPRVRSRLERLRLLQRAADTDALTGVASRARLEADVEALLRLADRTGVPVAVALLDLDRFKGINDRYGHSMGDAVLAHLGGLLPRLLRPGDAVGRWGGEEFLVALLDADAVAAVHRLEAVLAAFAAEPFRDGRGATFHAAFSAGVAAFPDDGRAVAELVRRADERMYEAKAAGRARVAGPGRGARR